MGAYCRTHGVTRDVCGCRVPGSFDCSDAHRILGRLTEAAHTPTAVESAAFWLDTPKDEPRSGQEPPAASKTGNPASGSSSARREPHTKPKVVPILVPVRTDDYRIVAHRLDGWFVVQDCCPLAPGEEPPADYNAWDWYFNEQSEAMDAALTHVIEHHMPTLTWLDTPIKVPRPTRDDDPLNRAHNTAGGSRD